MGGHHVRGSFVAGSPSAKDCQIALVSCSASFAQLFRENPPSGTRALQLGTSKNIDARNKGQEENRNSFEIEFRKRAAGTATHRNGKTAQPTALRMHNELNTTDDHNLFKPSRHAVSGCKLDTE